jgi:hypothetical protein
MAIIKKTKSHMKKSLKKVGKSLKRTKRKTMKGKVMREKVMRGGSSKYATGVPTTGVPPVNLVAAITQAASQRPRRNKESEMVSKLLETQLRRKIPTTKMGMVPKFIPTRAEKRQIYMRGRVRKGP